MILNSKVFNPGDLRTSITLQSRLITTGSGGFMVPSGFFIATVWAKWVNAFGSEVWLSQTAGAIKPATVTIRYRDDIDETCNIVKDGVVYEIVSIDDIQNRHEYLEIKVQAVTAA
jgi:SPP1 family predicted phage head-tail adaptor